MGEWERVTVDDEGRVEKMNLRNEQLTSVPAGIEGLTALKVLRLNDNQLTGIPVGPGRKI